VQGDVIYMATKVKVDMTDMSCGQERVKSLWSRTYKIIVVMKVGIHMADMSCGQECLKSHDRQELWSRKSKVT
jgi:hypothetical protein